MEQRDESLEPLEHLEPNFEPNLERAQATLEVALREACAADVRGANTGEMIRIDEMLAIAGQAAKEVISVRRRVHLDRRGDDRSHHREFDGRDGVRWKAFAVYPSRATDTRVRLPGSFQDGWLSFDCGRETRRHSPIPDNWHELSDDALRSLLRSGTSGQTIGHERLTATRSI